MAVSEPISTLLAERIEAGDFPSAVYLAAEKGEMVFSGALGLAVAEAAEPEKIPARIGTIYDLASITKPLITGLLCAKLLESGQLGLSDMISKYFPKFDTADKKEITLRQLLTHTSGFTAWKPFYLLTGLDRAADHEAKKIRIVELIASEPLTHQTGTEVVYSDLNFLMLGFLIEQIYGERIDTVAQKEIFTLLGLEKTFFNPPSNLKKEIAASERGNNYEKQTCVGKGYDVSGGEWREDIIWGEVHDGNAYYLDGAAGHAGIFSTAEETLKIARQFLAGSAEILKAKTCEMFHTNFTRGLNEARSAAFQLAETGQSTASEALAKNSFGHLGFTGTSVWIEPGTEKVFILLTNRTHASKPPFVNINSTRREFHRLAAKGG
jgi:CubicO group peptidase (beta-lactamase class C family)